MTENSVATRIAEAFDDKSLKYFTLEPGAGETYRTNKPTLYGHGSYPRSSVLYGRERRVFIDSFETEPEADEAIKAAKKLSSRKRVKVEKIGGSTHVPIDQIVSHLPDDTDY